MEDKFRRHKSGGMNGDMFSEGRKKSKLDAIARMNTLWIPSSPRIILVGSRLTRKAAGSMKISVDNMQSDAAGAFLVSGADHYKAIIKT